VFDIVNIQLLVGFVKPIVGFILIILNFYGEGLYQKPRGIKKPRECRAVGGSIVPFHGLTKLGFREAHL